LIAERYKPQLTVEDIEEILGIEKYDEEIAEKTRYFIRYSYPNPGAAVLPMRGQPREKLERRYRDSRKIN
jgi:hypothetical protein